MTAPSPTAVRVVGIDVGGTKVSTAALHGGELSEPLVERTDTSSTAGLLDQLERTIRAHGPCDAVGVAVPATVDQASGSTRFAVNVPLTDVPLRRILSERLGIPVAVDNDGTAAALAEAYNDELRLLADVVLMLTVGTGVGGGIIIAGRAFRGATGAAAEIGHMLVAADVAQSAPSAALGFPRPGSLEHVASGSALDQLADELGHAGGGRQLVAAAQRGEPAAHEALRIAGERLGIGIANLINIFDPDLVVVGGGVSEAGELLLGPAREAAWRLVLPGVGTRASIERARYGTSAGVRGAALVALDALGGIALDAGGFARPTELAA